MRGGSIFDFPDLFISFTQAGKNGDDTQSPPPPPEEERARVFDEARASVISDYLLARLKLVDGDGGG